MATPGFLGSMVQTTNIYTLISRLQEAPPGSEEFKDLIVQLFNSYNTTANVVNSKETGIYDNVNNNAPVLCNKTWFTTQSGVRFRDSLRVVVDFGTLPNAGTTSVAHNIPFNANYILTRLEGYATDPTGLNYIPIPYAGAANSIELNLDATNVNIITTTNRTAFTTCYVVIEYIPF